MSLILHYYIDTVNIKKGIKTSLKKEGQEHPKTNKNSVCIQYLMIPDQIKNKKRKNVPWNFFYKF